MKIRGLSILTLAVMCLIFFPGCKDLESIQTGRVVMKITDAPFPISLIDEASVTITKVEVRSATDTIGSPFITLMEDTLVFNLLELRNGVTAELLDAEIPVGEYDHIRLYVNNASIAVRDYDTYSMKVPSGAQTGIKIFINPSLRIAGGLTSELLLDFNVERSFVLKGDMNTPAGIKGFNFKPVIRAINNTSAGVVEGVVMDADSILISDASVWIEQDTVVSTAYTNDEGYYAMMGIPAGLYSLSSVKEGFDTITFNEIEVIEGNLTVQNFVLEAKEE